MELLEFVVFVFFLLVATAFCVLIYLATKSDPLSWEDYANQRSAPGWDGSYDEVSNVKPAIVSVIIFLILTITVYYGFFI